ncbi:MAG: TIGR03862 family flavoprotein [Betaproteobacteria bacterium]|nr:TIGR03862 family flavoprotein [Betaproteobacteria bacterium]
MTTSSPCVAIIGAGPAGLMAAEALSRHGQGLRVDVYDAMPSVARKFLMAGKGGLNLTHAEPREAFMSRYGSRSERIAPLLEAFGPQALHEWVRGLGIETFIGSSGRVFPADMKAAPLLCAWLHRLRQSGVHFHMRHRWCGWETPGDGGRALRFFTSDGEQAVRADAVILALGGGSWARLGSDGAWTSLLAQEGVAVAPLRSSNCGFDAAGEGWSEHFRGRFAGQPVKPVVVSFTDSTGHVHRKQGEFVVTASGVEGGLIYALSASLRDTIAATGSATLHLDLAPGWELSRLTKEVSRPRGSRSISSHLQSRLNIKGVKTGLLRELLTADDFADPVRLAAAIKALPLRLSATRPLDEAISSAGGVAFESLDERLMIRSMPGVFCAGEMLDWEAPTGGYLLTACFASGHAAGLGARDWLHHVDSGSTAGAADSEDG